MDTEDATKIQETLDRVIDMLQGIHADIRMLKTGRNMIGGERILDFNEVCEMLHMGERQVRRYRERGKLKGFLLDSRRMYWESEVQQFLKQYKEELAETEPESDRTDY